MSKTLHTCPDCGQENFSARGLKTHQGGKTCKARAGKKETTALTLVQGYEEAAEAEYGLTVTPQIPLTLSGAEGVDVIRWLERAVPAYEQARVHTGRMAVMIGYALLTVRDHGPRGAMSTLKKMQIFGKSKRTLDRCAKLAQLFADAQGLTKDAKLIANNDAAAFFQAEFDFNDVSGNALMMQMAAFVGDSSITELLEKDLLGVDDNTPPTGHQGEIKRDKKTKSLMMRAHFIKAFKSFLNVCACGDWKALYLHAAPGSKPGQDCGLLDLEAFLLRTYEEVKSHNKQQAAQERSTKGTK